jgi:hypothetical protein
MLRHYLNFLASILLHWRNSLVFTLERGIDTSHFTEAMNGCIVWWHPSLVTFLNSATIFVTTDLGSTDISDLVSPIVEGCSGHCRILSSFQGFIPLDISSNTLLQHKIIWRTTTLDIHGSPMYSPKRSSKMKTRKIMDFATKKHQQLFENLFGIVVVAGIW